MTAYRKYLCIITESWLLANWIILFVSDCIGIILWHASQFSLHQFTSLKFWKQTSSQSSSWLWTIMIPERSQINFDEILDIAFSWIRISLFSLAILSNFTRKLKWTNWWLVVANNLSVCIDKEFSIVPWNFPDCLFFFGFVVWVEFRVPSQESVYWVSQHAVDVDHFADPPLGTEFASIVLLNFDGVVWLLVHGVAWEHHNL